ncbi:MAG: sensor histidine kinase [Anaerolineales bacterium]|nr:sensor histidine kinase [Anaerolineales bacterium]
MSVISSRSYRANFNFWLLTGAAIATYFLVSVPTLFAIYRDFPEGFGLALVLGLLYGILLATYWFLEQRWQIHLVILAKVVIVTALIFIDPPITHAFSTLFFVISAQLLLFLPPWEGIAWIIILTVSSLAGEAYLTEGIRGILDESLATVGGFLFFATFGAMFRMANEARQRSDTLATELQAANQQLADYAAEVEKLAIVDERNRLARELHDALGHRLTVAVVQLEGARRLIPKEPERAAAMVETMRTELKEGLAELRETVATLRQQPSEHLTLNAALSALIDHYRQATGLTVHTDLPASSPAISPAAHHALFRATQESLTNVQRHADATEVWVSLQQPNGALLLSVSDNGLGYPDTVPADRFGIQGIRERIELLGGDVHLGRSEAGGARLEARLPIGPAGAHHE